MWPLTRRSRRISASWTFSWAFDTVPRQRFLGKLAHYGIQGCTNSWICVFLTGRRMSVIVDGESSEPMPILSGVPQGTVLRPLLFLIYINDMPSQVSKGTCIWLFADDCLVYRWIQKVKDQTILQKNIDCLRNWAIRWGMTFNPRKCYIMHITRGADWTSFIRCVGQSWAPSRWQSTSELPSVTISTGTNRSTWLPRKPTPRCIWYLATWGTAHARHDL